MCKAYVPSWGLFVTYVCTSQVLTPHVLAPGTDPQGPCEHLLLTAMCCAARSHCFTLQCAISPDRTLIEQAGQRYMQVLLHMWCMHSMNCEWCQNTVSVHVAHKGYTGHTTPTHGSELYPVPTQPALWDYLILQESVPAEKQQGAQDECYKCHHTHQRKAQNFSEKETSCLSRLDGDM